MFGRVVALEIRPDNFVELDKPFRIEGLRITFTVKRNLKKSTNQATIEIYNLSDATRARIQEHTRKVTLLAGYADGEGELLLFEGSIMTVNHPRMGSEIVTRIEANDGQTALRQAHVSLSYSQGVKGSQILKDVVSRLGLPAKFISTIGTKAFSQGFVHHGPAKDAMDKICTSMGLEWSVQNGSVQVLENGKPDNSDPRGIVLTPESGLLGSPERLRQIQDDPLVDKKPSGYTIKALLVPKINPGGYVAVRSREIPRATAYRVESVEHKGDTHGDDWTSTIEVYDPGVPI